MSYNELLFIFSIALGVLALVILFVVKWQVGRYALNFKYLNTMQKIMVNASGMLLFVALVTYFLGILLV